MLTMLAMPADARLGAEWQWGGAVADGQVTQPPEILFPRIETDAA
jgi:hypothetical protein